MASTRMQTVKGAVKRLRDITVVDLHKLGIRDMNNLLTSLPIVIEQVQGEKKRRSSVGAVSYSAAQPV